MVYARGYPGENWKLARHIITVAPNNVEVRLIDESTTETMFVSWDLVRPCYILSREAGREWPAPHRKRRKWIESKLKEDRGFDQPSYTFVHVVADL